MLIAPVQSHIARNSNKKKYLSLDSKRSKKLTILNFQSFKLGQCFGMSEHLKSSQVRFLVQVLLGAPVMLPCISQMQDVFRRTL